MNFPLNSTPHLSMIDITRKLFNNKFLSDIQFRVGDDVIYAHSLELMKRSAVFEAQLAATMGDIKLIPITDCKYSSFLEFIRFIYTDECSINSSNGIDLIKLSTKYQVIKLENMVLNSLSSINFIVQLYGHCVVEKYELARAREHSRFAINYDNCLQSPMFLSLPPEAVQQVLQMDQIEPGIPEVEIFDALAKWLKNYCKINGISIREGSRRFQGLIQHIRFPTMSLDEIRECSKKYPYILDEDDRKSIGAHVLFGDNSTLWISKPRSSRIFATEWREVVGDAVFETKLWVRKDTVLRGIRVGIDKRRREIELDIIARDYIRFKWERIQFTQASPLYWNNVLISLGQSIHLRPHYEYTITVKYSKDPDKIMVLHRKQEAPLIYNDPGKHVQFQKIGQSVLEIIFGH